MSVESIQSRRTVLAAAAGAVGGLVLHALGRPTAALAEGENVTVGGEFTTATSVTKITSSTDGIAVFEARNSATGAAGVGIKTHSNNGTAFLASSSNLTPAPQADTTIYGFHNGSQLGHSPVVARFEATEQSPSFATAIALQVIGKTQFKKSGVAVVPAGQKKVIVSVSQISNGSFGFATLQQFRKGVHVAAVTHDVTASTITIMLNTTVGSATNVGWLVTETP